ncbi:hypothetical protein F5148DRAFT_1288803 [Russula earlei]|uniref:Uncharacterized protein n=1 Tax=Russula earlei TaxID=71964 RepID=A0ACC0U0J2_9AGAM|nr:hypothetical protein F5148DRAFT_1288803 [Russula earlei]
MNAELDAFGEIGKLLSDLGKVEKTQELSETGLNRSFTMRWTCLSLVATRQMLKTNQLLQQYARGTIVTLALHKEVEDVSLDTDELAFRNAREIDERSVAAWACVEKLYQAFARFSEVDDVVNEVKETLRRHEAVMEHIQVEAHDMGLIDRGISTLQSEIDRVTHGLTRQLPGITFDIPTGPTPLKDTFDFLSNPIRSQLLYLQPRLQGLCSISKGQSIREVVEETMNTTRTSSRLVVSDHRLMERQLWRLQDLYVGGAFGFTLELYFLALRQLLMSSASSSTEFTTFYIGAFKTITSDWEQYKNSLGTQQIILNIVCDIAERDRGMFSNHPYPDNITTELLKLLGKMIEGQTSAYIDAAMKELRDIEWRHGDQGFRVRALGAIMNHRSPSGS